MDQQNTNNQGTQDVQPQNAAQSSNNSNRTQRTGQQNSRPQAGRSRFNNQERRAPQDRSQPGERNFSKDRNQNSDRTTKNNRARPQNDSQVAQKSKNLSNVDKPRENNSDARRQQGKATGTRSDNRNNYGRYSKNHLQSNIVKETAGRSIKPRRIETVEDIQADAERVEKDIQFEIKQIRAVKLGL